MRETTLKRRNKMEKTMDKVSWKAKWRIDKFKDSDNRDSERHCKLECQRRKP